MRLTTAALTWASRWIGAASRMAYSPATGTMPDSTFPARHFNPFADDVRSFPVTWSTGEVWVDMEPPVRNERQHWRGRLEDGLEHSIRLVIAKAVLGLNAARRRLPGAAENRHPVRHQLLGQRMGRGHEHPDLHCQHPSQTA